MLRSSLDDHLDALQHPVGGDHGLGGNRILLEKKELDSLKRRKILFFHLESFLKGSPMRKKNKSNNMVEQRF